MSSIWCFELFFDLSDIQIPTGSHCVCEQEGHQALNWSSAEILERPQSLRLHSQRISSSDGPHFISARFKGTWFRGEMPPKEPRLTGLEVLSEAK